MAIETETYTLKELCARLGKPTCERYTLMDGNTTLVGSNTLKNRGVTNAISILSINDKLPSDECEKCHHDRKCHVWICGCRWATKRDDCLCQVFKPLLRTVKSIKLVERCEKCDLARSLHESSGVPTSREYAELLSITRRGGQLCFDFKPVQMVELELI